jgi:hypothetical protein
MINLDDKEVVQENSKEILGSRLGSSNEKTVESINQVVQPRVKIKFTNGILNSQIDFNQWYGFFKTMWMINNQFNWIQYYRYYYNIKKFEDEIDEDEEDSVIFQEKSIRKRIHT